MSQIIHRIVTAEQMHAAEACAVIKRSIIEACMPHYNGNDKFEFQQKWLENKTPENVSQWISNPDNVSIVSLEKDKENERVTGLAMGSREGEILLLYILPEMRGKNLGYQLYAELEEALRAEGVMRLHLESTACAVKFYKQQNYTPILDEKSEHPFWTPMERALV